MSLPLPPWLPDGYLPAGRNGADFVSHDGQRILDVKLGAQGTRDLHGALMHLALLLAEGGAPRHACLVVRFPRMTASRARQAWNQARAVLHPEIAGRLAIVVLARGGESWCDPADAWVAEIATAVAVHARSDVTPRSVRPDSAKFLEVWKVLLIAWLQRSGPISVQELTERVGCSRPTAMRALEYLAGRSELRRIGRGQVELTGFPRKTFAEAVLLVDALPLRQTSWFVDVSGRPGDPLALLRRLNRGRPQAVAVGGVVAARRLDPDFDLHGTPRLDLTYWAPGSTLCDLEFVHRTDPGLRASPSAHNAVLAVHRLARANPLFNHPEGEALPLADPVEVLLDLHELHLDSQAEMLVGRLRPEASA